ncbi:MAG: DoxX family protein [Bacteroidia bacterium]|nr:DoxX family protein [Bacteroidia bacterium]NNM22715.1 DoxX family protein [Flavobacteriaceae bacterium]
MKRNKDLGLLILRVGISALFLGHGIGKFLDFVNGNTEVGGDPIGLGGLLSSILVIIAEFIAPVLIIIGLKTRIAAIFPVIAMAVAAFVVHANDSLEDKEMALLYMVGFLAISIMGAGRFSLDKR